MTGYRAGAGRRAPFADFRARVGDAMDGVCGQLGLLALLTAATVVFFSFVTLAVVALVTTAMRWFGISVPVSF